MSNIKNYSNFILIEEVETSTVQPTTVQAEPKDETNKGISIEELLSKMKEKLLQKKEKSHDSTPTQIEQKPTVQPIDGVDDRDTIKVQTDKIKELVKNTPKEKLNDMLTKCVNLISLTQKEIKSIESLKLNNDNITKKLNILKRNIQLLEDAKTDIVNKMGGK